MTMAENKKSTKKYLQLTASNINSILKGSVYVFGLLESLAFRGLPFLGVTHTPLLVSLASSIGIGWLSNKLAIRYYNQIQKQPSSGLVIKLFQSIGVDTSIIIAFQANTYNIFLNFFVTIIEESLFKNLGF